MNLEDRNHLKMCKHNKIKAIMKIKKKKGNQSNFLQKLKIMKEKVLNIEKKAGF